MPDSRDEPTPAHPDLDATLKTLDDRATDVLDHDPDDDDRFSMDRQLQALLATAKREAPDELQAARAVDTPTASSEGTPHPTKPQS